MAKTKTKSIQTCRKDIFNQIAKIMVNELYSEITGTTYSIIRDTCREAAASLSMEFKYIKDVSIVHPKTGEPISLELGIANEYVKYSQLSPALQIRHTSAEDAATVFSTGDIAKVIGVSFLGELSRFEKLIKRRLTSSSGIRLNRLLCDLKYDKDKVALEIAKNADGSIFYGLEIERTPQAYYGNHEYSVSLVKNESRYKHKQKITMNPHYSDKTLHEFYLLSGYQLSNMFDAKDGNKRCPFTTRDFMFLGLLDEEVVETYSSNIDSKYRF